MIWALVSLAGVSGVKLASEFGYGDGSGIYRVVQRLNKKAQHDEVLYKKLEALKNQSRVKPRPRRRVKPRPRRDPEERCKSQATTPKRCKGIKVVR